MSSSHPVAALAAVVSSMNICFVAAQPHSTVACHCAPYPLRPRSSGLIYSTMLSPDQPETFLASRLLLSDTLAAAAMTSSDVILGPGAGYVASVTAKIQSFFQNSCIDQAVQLWLPKTLSAFLLLEPVIALFACLEEELASFKSMKVTSLLMLPSPIALNILLLHVLPFVSAFQPF